MFEIAERLRAASRPERLQELGFRADDATAVTDAVAEVTRSEDELRRVALLADRLIAQIGWFAEPPEGLFDHDLIRDERHGAGVLPMLALMLTADDVADFHHSRNISAEVSRQTLSDLGQQVWVHRQTYGAFGLHTQGWLTVVWSGALYALGRLQFNLLGRPDRADWVLSTHIPETGPLSPSAVEESFRRARQFFADHFDDYDVSRFHCSSWLLDPRLTEELGDETNMGQFQRRWRLDGSPRIGDADALFFTFRRRGDVDLDELPQNTSLERVIVERLKRGAHWYVWDGYLDFDQVSLEGAA